MINAADRKEEYLRDAFNLLQTHMIFLSKAKENKQTDSQASTASNILPREIMNLIGLQMSALEALEQLSALVSLMQKPGLNFDTDALININNALASAISMSCYALNSIQHIYNTSFTRVTELIGDRKEELLRTAAEAGRALAVAQLLKINGIDVNAQDMDGVTALMCASINGHAPIVTELLKMNNKVNGIDVNAQDMHGVTALMYASEHGHASVITELLKTDGIQVNGKNNKGWTALMYAAWYGWASVITELLKVDGILVNTQDKDGWTALMYASSERHTAIVYQLCMKQLFDAPYDQGNELFQQLTSEIKSAGNKIDINQKSFCQYFIDSEELPTVAEEIALLEKAVSGKNGFSALMQKEQRLQLEAVLTKLKSSNSTQPVLFSEAAGAPSSSSNPTANTSFKLIRSECSNQ